MAITTVPVTDINETEFTELVVDLLEDFVHGDASPFKDVKSVLEDYLDGAVDLDPTQKAGIFSDWLKSAYSDINKQAMGTALDILKTNSDLEYQRYAVEADYNLKVAQEEKVRAEIDKLISDDANIIKEGLLLDQKLLNDKVAYMIAMAQLQKQYGYGDASLDSALDLAMNASTNDGALDKQIAGYDKLNLKDMLKTMDEKAALMQNAKIPETLEEKKARIETMYEIAGLNYDVLDGSNTWRYTPNEADGAFDGSWAQIA